MDVLTEYDVEKYRAMEKKEGKANVGLRTKPRVKPNLSFKILKLRFHIVPEQLKQAISEETDSQRLSSLLHLSATVSSLEEFIRKIK